jgi:hypothetical protein
MVMKKKYQLGIIIGIAIIVTVVLLATLAIPIFTTSTLRIKYISAGSENDGVSHGGNIVIIINSDLPDSADWIHQECHADQYITFNGLSIGAHKIEIEKGTQWDNWSNPLLARANAMTEALWPTTVDLQYWDGIH